MTRESKLIILNQIQIINALSTLVSPLMGEALKEHIKEVQKILEDSK